MTKSVFFQTIKEANKLVDMMASISTSSAKYNELSEALYWTLDVLTGYKWFTLRLSNRTGHYYVTF